MTIKTFRISIAYQDAEQEYSISYECKHSRVEAVVQDAAYRVQQLEADGYEITDVNCEFEYEVGA